MYNSKCFINILNIYLNFSSDQLALESRIEPLCQELLKNNLTTGNFGALIELLIIKSNELLSATNTDA